MRCVGTRVCSTPPWQQSDLNWRWESVKSVDRHWHWRFLNFAQNLGRRDFEGEPKCRGNREEGEADTSTLCTMYKSKNWKRQQQHRQILIRRNAQTHTNTQDKLLEKDGHALGSGEWPSVPFQHLARLLRPAWCLPACAHMYDQLIEGAEGHAHSRRTN